MKEFFLLLFFLKTTILTSAPVIISTNGIEIIPEKPLKAVTGGAAVYIDVSVYLKNNSIEDIEKKFPEGSVHGKIITYEGKEIELLHQGYSLTGNKMYLIIGGNNPFPTNIDFSKVILFSQNELQNVFVVWMNGKH